MCVCAQCGLSSGQVPEWCLDHWHPSEKAMYPDYFAKREQWKKLREQSWDREVDLHNVFQTKCQNGEEM